MRNTIKERAPAWTSKKPVGECCFRVLAQPPVLGRDIRCRCGNWIVCREAAVPTATGTTDDFGIKRVDGGVFNLAGLYFAKEYFPFLDALRQWNVATKFKANPTCLGEPDDVIDITQLVETEKGWAYSIRPEGTDVRFLPLQTGLVAIFSR